MSINVNNTPDMYKIYTSGRFTFNTKCRVRNTPDMSDPGIVTYQVGQSVNYDSKLKNGNHLWLSYMSNSGGRHYVPYANTDKGTYFGTDTNPGNPIKPASTNVSGGTPSTSPSHTNHGLGTLTGYAGANVADQTPDGTTLVISGSYKYDEPARGRDRTNMTNATTVDHIKIGDTIYYNAKIKSDGHYWLRYIHTSGATYYVPYATIDPYRPYGVSDSHPGDPVYSQETVTTPGDSGNNSNTVNPGNSAGNSSAGGLTPGQSLIDFVRDLGGISGLSESNCRVNDNAFQKLVDFHPNSKVTVRIPAGVYKVGRPEISSNVDFIGEDGATFLGTQTDNYASDTAHSGAAFQYECANNVAWSNVTFRGIDYTASNGSNVYRLVHNLLTSHNVSFTKCIFDQTESNGGHCIDLCGSSHIYINDSTFIGVGFDTIEPIRDKYCYKEAIQIDYDYESGTSATPLNHTYTFLPTHDVFINQCRFLPLYTDNEANHLKKFGPHPVGTHKTLSNNSTDGTPGGGNRVPSNIQMTNCLVLDPKPANYGGYGYFAPIHFPSVQNVTFTGNQIERRKTQVSPNVFMFYNYKKNVTVKNNSGFTINNNSFFNMNPQLVHVRVGNQSNAERALASAPSYVLFTVSGGHTMSNIHVDYNKIYTYKSMLQPTKQDGKTIPQKAKDIHDSSNMRVKGVGAGSTWSSSQNVRLPMPEGGNGNEAAHHAYSQSIYGVLPNGQQFLITTVTSNKNLPYEFSLSSHSGYEPAVSTITVGFESNDSSLYMPYI